MDALLRRQVKLRRGESARYLGKIGSPVPPGDPLLDIDNSGDLSVT
jgi:hypothetical protein